MPPPPPPLVCRACRLPPISLVVPLSSSQEVADYWSQVLQTVDKSTARALLPHIDTQLVRFGRRAASRAPFFL